MKIYKNEVKTELKKNNQLPVMSSKPTEYKIGKIVNQSRRKTDLFDKQKE